MLRATSSPHVSATNPKVTSIPALTPPDDQTFPSWTHRAVLSQVTFGPYAIVRFHDTLFVVARRPSKTPARATIDPPVHTLMIECSFGYVARTQSIVAFRSGARVPSPPGTKSTSRSSGTVASVCVGTMDWNAVELYGFIAAERGCVDTASSESVALVLEMR